MMGSGSAYTFTWQNGRELAGGTKGSTSFAYTYNSDGLRTQKVVGNLVYTYYWQGSQLAAMTIVNTSENISSTLKFYYDSNGIPFVLDYNGTIYFYVTNLQGDVIGLATSEGMCGYYRYDAWGQIVAMDAASSSFYNALEANPLRYRGYVYDNETGFYYLQSRYYDPAVCRFINADGYVSTGTGTLGYNMFAYCNNNPIMKCDPTGRLGISLPFVYGLISKAISTLVVLIGTCVMASYVIEHPVELPSISIPDISIKDDTDSAEKEAVLPEPPSMTQTYYHITTPENAAQIKSDGYMIGSPWEGYYVYAWTMLPNEYAIANSGAHFGVVISFKTDAQFVPDPGIDDPLVKMFNPVVSITPGPIYVWDVKIIEVKNGYYN